MSKFAEKYVVCCQCGKLYGGSNDCHIACFEDGACGNVQECAMHLEAFPGKRMSKGLCAECHEKFDRIRDDRRYKICPLEHGCPLKTPYCSEARFLVCRERERVQVGYASPYHKLEVRKELMKNVANAA